MTHAAKRDVSPSQKVDGLSVAKATDENVKAADAVVGNGKKNRSVVNTVLNNPGITTAELRNLTGSSNPSNVFSTKRTKLMNVGMLPLCVPPLGEAPNADFHKWYIVEAPMANVVVSLSKNDPIF